MISKQEALAVHFADGAWDDGDRPPSAFMAGLRDARMLTGRDGETGAKEAGRPHGSRLGAIGYLVLLDQVGRCFMPTGGVRRRDGNEISYALACFTDLGRDEADALYALRTSFGCDYGLTSVPAKASHLPRYTHAFRLCDGEAAPVVTLPRRRWDGDRRSICADTQTVVNLEALGDLVEAIASGLIAMADGRKLTIILKGGPEALVRRYSPETPSRRRRASCTPDPARHAARCGHTAGSSGESRRMDSARGDASHDSR